MRERWQRRRVAALRQRDRPLELDTTITAKAGLATDNCDAIEALAASAP